MALGFCQPAQCRAPAAAAGHWCTRARRCSPPTTLQHASRPFQSASRQLVKLVPAAVAAGQTQTRTQAQPPPHQQPKQHFRERRAALQDPAKLAGSLNGSVEVPDRGGAVSLDAYMRLPPEQYNELDPALITALGGSTFLLTVPRLSLFGVWVEPQVTVSVRLADGGPGGVVFESGECRLRGSDLLTQLGLDRRFVLYFHTLLTWQSGPPAAAATEPAAAAPTAQPSGSGSGSDVSGIDVSGSDVSGSSGAIKAQVDVQVWTEVVGPFRAIPRGVLQATGNAVMGALMQALLPLFLQKLADDYHRWSTDPAYRARRAAAASQPPPPQQLQPQ